MLPLKILHATRKTRSSQINRYLKRERERDDKRKKMLGLVMQRKENG